MEGAASALSQADVEAIEAVHRRWIAAESSGNSKVVLELCTDDVVWIPPGRAALRGKPAIGEWLDQPGGEIRQLQIRNVRISGSGSVAYKLADYEARVVPPGSPDQVTATGIHLWVLRRRADSTWAVAVVTWNWNELTGAV